MSSNPFEGWPADLIQTYKELPLPTLYDFAVSGEKLSAEIRKQNKEIKLLTEKLERLTVRQETSAKSASSEEESRCRNILMAAFDACAQFEEQVGKLIRQESGGFLSKRRISKKKSDQLQKAGFILQSLLQGIGLIQQRFISSLADVGLEAFCPMTGEVFSPTEHRAVLQVQGGMKGTIHKTVRWGYKTSQGVFRYADVVVYQNK